MKANVQMNQVTEFSAAVLGSRCVVQVHNIKSTACESNQLHYIGRPQRYVNKKSGAEGVRRGSALANEFSLWRNGGVDESLRGASIECYRYWLKTYVLLPGLNGGEFSTCNIRSKSFRPMHYDKWRNRRAFKELMQLAWTAVQGTVRLSCWCAPAACHGDVIAEAIQYLVRLHREKKIDICGILQAMAEQDNTWRMNRQRQQ